MAPTREVEVSVDTEGMALELAELGSATLGESGAAVMAPRLRPAWPGAELAAPAYPVTCTPGDNLAVHVAVSRAPWASALVVDVGSVAERGYWGEVLTTAAEARGLAGLVIDGGVRDVAALETHRFAVFSSMIALRGATKERPGAVGRPSRVGGVEVAAGDWVVGDVDGVVVIAAASLDQVMSRAIERRDKEAEFFAELTAGKTTLDLLSLDGSAIEGS